MLSAQSTPIPFLLAAHVVVGLLLTPFIPKSGPDYLIIGFIALIFAQAGLLGICAALANQPLGRRLLISFLGLSVPIGLSFIVMPQTSDRRMTCVLMGITASSIGLIWGVQRLRGVLIQRVNLTAWQTPPDAIRFTISHLLIWTFVVAAIVKIGQSAGQHRDLATYFSFGLTFIGASMATPWAALGRGKVWLRSAIILTTATLLGLFPPLYMKRPHDWWMWPLAMAMQSSVVLLTLLVLRRWNYRLVRIPASGEITKAPFSPPVVEVAANVEGS